jgi:hypothetical protein
MKVCKWVSIQDDVGPKVTAVLIREELEKTLPKVGLCVTLVDFTRHILKLVNRGPDRLESCSKAIASVLKVNGCMLHQAKGLIWIVRKEVT